MRDRNGQTTENLIRMPAEVARAVLGHPQFRYLGCAARLRGDWVQRKSDGAKFFEVYEPSADDARQLMEFAERVAGHLLKATTRTATARKSKIMNTNMSVAIGDCAREGKKAFEQLGVTGVTAHSYPEGSVQKVAFVSGFSDEQHQASERALSDASAYHALCVRDAALDRAWAEKLGKARGL